MSVFILSWLMKDIARKPEVLIKAYTVLIHHLSQTILILVKLHRTNLKKQENPCRQRKMANMFADADGRDSKIFDEYVDGQDTSFFFSVCSYWRWGNFVYADG